MSSTTQATRTWYAVEVLQDSGKWYPLSYWPTRRDANAEAEQLRHLGRTVRIVKAD